MDPSSPQDRGRHSADLSRAHVIDAARQHGRIPGTSMFSSVLLLLVLLLLVLLIASACNPFAPALQDDPVGDASLITDQTTVDGLFANFRYAYTFKDSTIYGGLLAQEFIFTYRDYERKVDESWGRDEEMRITWHLFQNASNLNLVWNNMIGYSGDSLRASVTRSFNLSVTFNPSDVLRVDGRVSLDLRRENARAPWKITQWRDESNY